MEKDRLEGDLAAADALVAKEEVHLASQQKIIAELKRAGKSATVAHQLLSVIKTTLVVHVRDRDRLKRKLVAFASAPRGVGL